jgi:hypothetical protein
LNIPPPLIPGTDSTGIIFAFTYMCLHCLHYIRPPTPSPKAPHTSFPGRPVRSSYSLIL